MPKSIWKGYISFGLVSIPVNAVPVEETKALHFHFIDERDKARVRYQRINETTGKEVPWDKIVKGFEFEKDNYVIVNEADFKQASPESYQSINIAEFVDYKEIDPLYFEKPYYLLPDSKNKKAYVLLREALKKTNKVGVAKVILRKKEYLSLIMPHDKAILLNLIHFKEELRQEEELNFPKESLKSYQIMDQEIKMAMELITKMSSKWEPEKYHDDYNKALVNWINKKTKGATISPVSLKSQKPSDVIDFMSLLKKSLEEKEMNKNKRKAQK